MRIKQFTVVFSAVYLLSAILFSGLAIKTDGKKMTESDLGVMCVQAVYPAATRGIARSETGSDSVTDSALSGIVTGDSDSSIIDTQDPENPTPQTIKKDNGKPLVIIYHTHATEAYQPIPIENNYRTTAEEGSVREVGTVLAAELESLGIGVVHDKTLHDAESYNQSYARSLETVNRLIKENPSAVFVIDLHRDAAAYTGGKSKTVEINGETVSSFAMVVGQGNENATALNTLAENVLATADEMYPGFAGRKIDKEYKYNQYVSDYSMLIEVGNNENDISETRLTGKYLAHVLKAVIDEVMSD
ncbi:MAG: stage II sporulation protein P [Firmicutes bacterium]|nr:stage II sporulation protein P [Bacillota bacterium]